MIGRSATDAYCFLSEILVFVSHELYESYDDMSLFCFYIYVFGTLQSLVIHTRQFCEQLNGNHKQSFILFLAVYRLTIGLKSQFNHHILGYRVCCVVEVLVQPPRVMLGHKYLISRNPRMDCCGCGNFWYYEQGLSLIIQVIGKNINCEKGLSVNAKKFSRNC